MATLRAHPLLVAVSALVVPLACVACDLSLRGLTVLAWGGAWTYATGALLSVLCWGLGMEAARHPRRAVRAAALAAIGATAAFGLGLQAVVRTFTHAYLGRRALLLALGIPNLTRSSYLAHDAPRIALACLVPGALAVILARSRARLLGVRHRRPSVVAAAGAAALLVTLFTPFTVQAVQCLPPDVLWINGTGGPLLYALGLQQKPKALPVGAHEALPAAQPAPAEAPAVVLILGESVRRDREGEPTPRLDEAAPARIRYARASSIASCTELASAALWTGMDVRTPPSDMARAPLVWDWARARGYRTAYLTAQNLLLGQSDVFLRGSRIDRLREARDRVIDAPIDDGSPDEDLTAEALAFLDAEGGPPFLVIHTANTHAPYRQDPKLVPHAGSDAVSRYRNSLARDDALLGDLVTRIRKTARGRGAVIVYTSDHGEAFGEHGASYHSFDLYAEQVDVPLWIDAPPGALPAPVRERMEREAAARPVAILDVTATIVDLVGGLDVPAFEAQAARLAGRSLLREPPGAREVVLWNCPPTRECATEAFGVIAFPWKLHYVGHDQRYACHDIGADPGERMPLPLDRCAGLFPVLGRSFGKRPGAP